MGQTRPAAACCVAEPFGDLALAIKARADSFSHPEFLAGGRARAPSSRYALAPSASPRPPERLQASERSEMGRVVRKGNEAV